MYQNPAATSEGTFTPDNLIAGDKPVRAEDVTIISGQDLARGAVLGRITASGKYTLSLSAAGDGSQTPVGILANDVDATGGDVAGVPMYREGDFNERALILGTGHTLDTVRNAFRGTAIHIQTSVAG